MRVYELAKKLGMGNRDLIPELKRMGITVASHSTALDDAAVQRAIEKFMPKAKLGGEESAKRDKKDAGPQKARVAREAKAREDGGSKAQTVMVEEPPKPDKRRILIKRKKTEEEGEPTATIPGAPGEVPSPFATEREAPLPPLAARPAAVPRPEVAPTTVPAAPKPSERMGALPELEPPPGGPGGVSPPLWPPAPAATAKPAPAPAVGQEERRPEKKKGLELEPAGAEPTGLREKLRKIRKTGRPLEDEVLKFREDAARWDDLRALPIHRREERTRHAQPTSVAEITKPRKKVIKLPAGLTVKEFAELVGQRPAEIIRKLMDTGVMLTLNQPMNPDAAVLIAEGLGLKVEVASEKEGDQLLEEAVERYEEELVLPRPPVITIMGHVDHGKTSLLDAVRQSRITEQEAGSITQHIGAYTVRVHGKQVTFLDTPGHEAFTAMRARGAKVTDIVVLVVAADDGVMPQTVEAINHATAAKVPIIVAINKIDKPGANPDRVKHALAEHNLIPESWGGQTIFVEVSAKQKTGLDSLLEMILLQAEVLELKANVRRPAQGTVIEAKLDRGRGPMATVLVQGGTLRVGDAFVVGSFSGRVRALITDTGEKVSEAGPSMPVEVIGLPSVPAAGEPFVVVKDERVAREIAEARLHKQRTAELAAGFPRVTLDDLYSRIAEGAVKELAVLIKADVQGSAEALSRAIEQLSTEAVQIRIIHSGVGGVTESDVLLASASRAVIIGFSIRPEPKAAALAEREGVDIRVYSVIYDAIADIKASMEGLLEPTLKERVLGRAEVRQLFNIPKVGVIAGCYVTEGSISKASAGVRVVRDHVTVYEGKIGSLRRFKDDVREVQQGYECGIGVENFNDLKVGDVLEVYVLDKVAAKL